MIRDVAVYLLNNLEMDQMGWAPFEATADLLGSESPVFPISPGVYLLMSERTLFTYPAGATSVFYIGQASNLRTRLRDHRKFTRHIRDGEASGRYFPRYEWAANHGALVTYSVPPRVNSTLTPKAMESQLIRTFALAFRAQPVANSQSAW